MPISRDKAPARGKNFYAKIDLPGLRFRGSWGFSENDWASIPQDPSVKISRNLHQAVPWHRRLINGSSNFEFWYGGRSVGLRDKTLDNRWAKRISIYSLARARITACRWIRDKSLHIGENFLCKNLPPKICGSGAVGLSEKTVGPLLRKIGQCECVGKPLGNNKNISCSISL